MNQADVLSFVLLTILSVSYSSALRRVERLRRAVALDHVPDMAGVWTFAGVLLLPVPLIVLLVIAVNLGEWPSRRVVGNGRPWKYVYSTAATATACVITAGVVRILPGAIALFLGVICFATLNMSFVAAAICASGKRHVLRMLANPRLHAVELSTQALGAGLGVAMHWHLPAAAFILPVILGLHVRAARDEVDEEKASFDPDTGLWRQDLWELQASDLAGQGKHVAVILVEVPATADWVKSAVAVRRCLRSKAVMGSHGEAIAVLTSAGIADGGELVAANIRAELAGDGLTPVVGSATSASLALPDLLAQATGKLRAESQWAGVLANW